MPEARHEASGAPEASRADAERVVQAMAQWRRRSRLIRFLRKALPVTIGVVVLALVGWIGLKSLLASLPDLASKGAEIRMINPRFYGQDERGRSFVLEAKEAERLNRDGGLVRLTDPKLKLTTGTNRSLEIAAKGGVYHQATREARLTGGVRVTDSSSGFVFQTGEARIDPKSGAVTGNSPVTARGPLGEISASSYAIHEQGSRMTFTGNVRTHIKQRAR